MITLRLEAPVGKELLDRSLPTDTPIRVTGKVTSALGAGASTVEVNVQLTNYDTGIVKTWKTRTNFVGNYWLDTRTPPEAGNYSYQALWWPYFATETSEPIVLAVGGVLPLPYDPGTFPVPAPLPPAETPEESTLDLGIPKLPSISSILFWGAVAVALFFLVVRRR